MSPEQIAESLSEAQKSAVDCLAEFSHPVYDSACFHNQVVIALRRRGLVRDVRWQGRLKITLTPLGRRVAEIVKGMVGK